MKLIDVAARAAAPTPSGVDAHFGVYLPGIDAAQGFEVVVRVIHSRDRFTPGVPTIDFPLAQVPGDPNTLWSADVHIPPQAGTAFGTEGVYLYRFRLLQADGGQPARVVTSWFTDPFALATDDVGQLSAVTTSGFEPAFTWTDGAWKVPELEDLVVYELHAEQFNGTFDGITDRIAYLASLGVTCIELMPVTSLKLDFDWGYGPLHYFAPNERWGGGAGLKRLVDACHAAGIAVIVDVVYQHVDTSFPYHQVYADAGIASPMIGAPRQFGPIIDYNRAFARDYVQLANLHWLEEYHVDGFRYDEVTDLYDGDPLGPSYPKMAYDAYNASLTMPRFTPSGRGAPGEYSRIIQCAEALGGAREVLAKTYTAAAWQDELLGKAEDMATHGFVDDAFAHLLDTRFSGYPLTKQVHDGNQQPIDMPVAPFQYLETHDHAQLVAFVAHELEAPLVDRSRWYKLQPFAIALYTAEGIPMLWEGQEFADNYTLPPSGDARIHFRRNTHWEFFYDDAGHDLVRLYRILGTLRHAHPALRSRDSFYDNVNSRPGSGVIVYRRRAVDHGELAVVALNFSDADQRVPIAFPAAGTYRELIDADQRPALPDVVVTQPGQVIEVEVPSNYGRIYLNA